MTREEEIKQFALERDSDGDFDSNNGYQGIIEGAQWADEHPKNPWRDAKKDPPKDGEWCLFKFTQSSWSHGLYEARQMPNTAISDYIKSGDIISWMPIPKTPE